MDDPRPLLAEQPFRIATLLVGATVAICGLAFAGYQWAKPTPATELAQWIPATAATATLLAAIVAAIFAAGAYRLEHRREVRLLDEGKRQQALTFAVWPLGASLGRAVAGNGDAHYDVGSPKLALRNGSDLPIYDVTLRVQTRSSEIGLDGLLLGRPEGDHLDLVPPRETQTVAVAGTFVVLPSAVPITGLSPMPEVKLRAAVQYRDNAGNYWRRHANGDFEPGKGELRC